VTITDHNTRRQDANDNPRPSVTADQLLLTARAWAGGETAAVQEKAIERLIADTPDDAVEKPDLYFRLADLYAEAYRSNVEADPR